MGSYISLLLTAYKFRIQSLSHLSSTTAESLKAIKCMPSLLENKLETRQLIRKTNSKQHPEMATPGLLFVSTNPDASKGLSAEAFNTWYNNKHIRELLQVPGLTTAIRYENADAEGVPKYLCLYPLADLATLATPELQAVSNVDEKTFGVGKEGDSHDLKDYADPKARVYAHVQTYEPEKKSGMFGVISQDSSGWDFFSKLGEVVGGAVGSVVQGPLRGVAKMISHAIPAIGPVVEAAVPAAGAMFRDDANQSRHQSQSQALNVTSADVARGHGVVISFLMVVE